MIRNNEKKKETIVGIFLLIMLFAFMTYLDTVLPSYHIAIKVIKKASVYALVAVSMNLLNGFTGLFSLGQAGFMMLGAYNKLMEVCPSFVKPYLTFDLDKVPVPICTNINL